MTPQRDYIRTLLDDLRLELRQLGLWSDEPPPVAAMESTEPFCVDTLRLEQWLQFILIARLEAVLERGAPLPECCDILPYAEEQLADDESFATLLRIIGKLDIMVTRAV